jgi:glutamine amidotransferase
MKKICILDYGLGNVRSLFNSLVKINYNPILFSKTKKKDLFDYVFIPGVGSFSKASELLINKKYINFLKEHLEHGKIFGICLGMQILLSLGKEGGNNYGLNFIKGKVEKLFIGKKKLILPFVGYQKINFLTNNTPLYLKNFDNEKFYFLHSYASNVSSKKNILAFTCREGLKYPAIIYKKNIIGTQFHPEKSGEIGLKFLKEVINNF